MRLGPSSLFSLSGPEQVTHHWFWNSLEHTHGYQQFFGGERGSGGVQSTGVSQRARATGRDESQSVPSPGKLYKARDLELPLFEGSLPSCSPHSMGYTCTFLHPYFPVENVFWVLSGYFQVFFPVLVARAIRANRFARITRN